jgi:hypothetical protein
MSLLPIFESLERSWLSTAMRAGAWQFPAVEILHIAGSIVVFGSVLIVNLRLLGQVFTDVSVVAVSSDLRAWNRLGLSAQFLTGPLLLITEATRFYANTPFRAKVTLLLLAILFQITIHRRVIASETPPSRGLVALVAGTSLALWLGVVLSGLSIELFG